MGRNYWTVKRVFIAFEKDFEIQNMKKNKTKTVFALIIVFLFSLPFALCFYIMDITEYPLYAYCLMSFVCFTAYYADKKRAEKNQWRIPEANLHILELLGGWPGALIAQRMFRHKTVKKSYQTVFWLIVTVHMTAWADYLIFNLFLFRQIREIIIGTN